MTAGNPKPSAGSGAVDGFVAFEIGEEALDRAAATLVVLEGLADDPAGQGRRHRADLGAQLRDHLATFGLDLQVRVLEDPQIDLTQWNHVAMVIGPAGMKLYRNGELVNESPLTFPGNVTHLQFGGMSDAARSIVGGA